MTEPENANIYPGDYDISEDIRDAIEDGKKTKDEIINYIDNEYEQFFTTNDIYLQHLNTLIDEEFIHQNIKFNDDIIKDNDKHTDYNMPSPIKSINIQELVGYETRSIESLSNPTSTRKPPLCRALSFQFSTEPITFIPALSRALSQPQSSALFFQIDEEHEILMDSEITMMRAKSVSFTNAMYEKSMDDQKSIDIESTPLTDNADAPPFLSPATQLYIDISKPGIVDTMDSDDLHEELSMNERKSNNNFNSKSSICNEQEKTKSVDENACKRTKKKNKKKNKKNKNKKKTNRFEKHVQEDLLNDKTSCVSCIPNKFVTSMTQSNFTLNQQRKSVNAETSNETNKSNTFGLIEASNEITKDFQRKIRSDVSRFADDEKEEEDMEETDIFDTPQKSKIERIKQKMKDALGDKTKKMFAEEATNEKCCHDIDEKIDKLEQLKNNCECLRRIEIVLEAHYELIHVKDGDKSTSDIIQQIDQYEHQQLFDDFSHLVMIHIGADNDANRSRDHGEYQQNVWYNIGGLLCDYLQSNLKCDVEKCKGFSRHHKEKINDEKEDFDHDEFCDVEDFTFQQECDKIHAYFLHSTIKFGTEPCQTHATEEEENHEIDKLKRYAKGRSIFNRHSVILPRITPQIANETDETGEVDVLNSPLAIVKEDDKETEKKSKKCFYIGKKEDDVWWKGIESDQTPEEMYNILARNMGVFRWQNPHGFGTGQNRETAHLRPKFNNIKEEALFNDFEPLSKDNWNQTLRKSKIFNASFASHKIRTKTNWYFHDQVTEHKEQWTVGDAISIQEVVTLKLYTDFDKLQFALKKCFRLETLDDILKDDKQIENLKQEYIAKKADLEKRLRHFFHWRGGLLLVLNKFGTKLNYNTNMVLYHGVNAKMIIRPSQTFAFNGPLSTTVSYHVARTFATAKGMVLKITSHFPRLDYCNAFDASLLSDYPEEQEWLVGFMYVRLLEVRTRKLIDTADQTFNGIIKKIPLASWVRQEFFAIHLFNQQIFSMSQRLEKIFAQFLKANRYECCRDNEIYIDQHKEFGDWNMEHMVKKICKISHGDGNKCHDETKEDFGYSSKQDVQRKQKIFPLLVKKFNDFRSKPNFKQRIKFDMISHHLKRFFMEEIDEKDINKDKQKWSISFDEIVTIYPNVEEIHFINQYKLTNKVFNNLLQRIQKKSNTINKVVFIYYNYAKSEKIFKDPDTLDQTAKSKFEKLKWKIKYGNIGKTGYKIRIYKTTSGVFNEYRQQSDNND